MADEQIADNRQNDGLLLETIKQLPDAAAHLLEDAWDHKIATVKHVALTLGTAAAAGKLFSLFIPARGPAAIAAGVVFTIPLVAKEYERWSGATTLAQDPDSDIEELAKGLARGTLGSGGDLVLGFVGGGIGSSLGRRVATSETAIGRFSQTAQRGVLSAENETLLMLNRLPDILPGRRSPQPKLVLTPAEDAAAGNAVWFARRHSLMESRLHQAAEAPRAIPQKIKVTGSAHSHTNLSDGTGSTQKNLQDAKAAGLDFYAITDHNHLAARDGIKPGDPRHGDQTGIPILASNPKAYGQQFKDAVAASRDGEFIGIIGVEMGTIGKVGGGKKHSHGAQFMRELDGSTTTQIRVTQPDGRVEVHTHKLDATHAKIVELSAQLRSAEPRSTHEHGDGHIHGDQHLHATAKVNDTTIPARNQLEQMPLTPQQQATADAIARAESHHGGVNHINLYEVPTFFEAVRQPRRQTLLDIVANPIRRTMGLKQPEVMAPPDVVRYNDGDYKSLVAHLDRLTDTTGQRPVIQLNHPRFKADWSPNLPVSARGRDYGIKSFDNIQQWREQFGKHASQIEIITGQAMKPKPTDVVRATDLGPINLAGYIDKGLHVSPTFGRDDHFNLPGGRPAGTNLYVDKLTRDGVMNALRERRTAATTSTEKLGGYMTVNDKHFMGDILDQAAVPDLNIKMHIDGLLAPQAKYQVSLYADRKVGDGRLAKPIQVRDLLGQDLLDTHGTVAFDQVRHTIGNKSAYYVEVQRTDPLTANVDYMWTAPIWVEPKAVHSTWIRGVVAAGTDALTGF